MIKPGDLVRVLYNTDVWQHSGFRGDEDVWDWVVNVRTDVLALCICRRRFRAHKADDDDMMLLLFDQYAAWVMTTYVVGPL